MNTKQVIIISIFLFIYVLYVIPMSDLYAQRYQGELMVTVCGMTGQDTSWTVTATALSSIRWHESGGECYLTSSYSSAVVSGKGNDGLPNGFEAPFSDCQCNRDLAFGLYRLSWDLPSPHSDPDPINDSEVAWGFTTETWTDEDVTIHGGGDELTYYVKAYLSDSPDSNPSNSVIINGNVSKKLAMDSPTTFDSSKSDKNVLSTKLTACPNPFNPTTTISFNLPTDDHVQLQIFDLQGRQIITLVDKKLAAGIHNYSWDGRDSTGKLVSSGIYIYTMKTSRFNASQKMAFVK